MIEKMNHSIHAYFLTVSPRMSPRGLISQKYFGLGASARGGLFEGGGLFSSSKK